MWLQESLLANAGDIRDPGSIPGSGRSLGGGHGNPLQYSCLENPMDRGTLGGYSPWGRTESYITEATFKACTRIPHNSGLILLKLVEMGNKKSSFCQVTRDLGLFGLIALPFLWWGSCPHELKQNSNDCNHISSSRIQEVKEKSTKGHVPTFF